MTGLCVDCITGAHGPNAHRKDLPTSPPSIPTERCGAGTLGMHGRILGPCLHPPGHPADLLHRDAHGSEWGEYNHTAPTRSDKHTKIEAIRALVDELEADPGLGGAYDANMDAVDRIRAILNGGVPATAAAPEICELPHQTIEEQEACEQQRLAEDERDQLVSTLREVLGHFVHKGHPGEPCLSSGWISEKAVARWRAIAYPTKERTP